MKIWKEKPNIELFSDGGAIPNPGKGGFGVIMVYKGHRKEFHQGYKLTTNNRMELIGVIFGLEQLKTKSNVTVFTDSKYVVDGIKKGWAVKWQKNNWKRDKNRPAINSDLWGKLLDLIDQHSVSFKWVKGHAGHNENERCDQLAEIAINSANLLEDVGYIPSNDKITDVKTHDNYERKKIIKEGVQCRKCNTPVIKKSTKKRKIKPDQSFY